MSPTVKTMLELNIDGASLQKEGAFLLEKCLNASNPELAPLATCT
jgi:hypothetical protein